MSMFIVCDVIFKFLVTPYWIYDLFHKTANVQFVDFEFSAVLSYIVSNLEKRNSCFRPEFYVFWDIRGILFGFVPQVVRL